MEDDRQSNEQYTLSSNMKISWGSMISFPIYIHSADQKVRAHTTLSMPWAAESENFEVLRKVVWRNEIQKQKKQAIVRPKASFFVSNYIFFWCQSIMNHGAIISKNENWEFYKECDKFKDFQHFKTDCKLIGRQHASFNSSADYVLGCWQIRSS